MREGRVLAKYPRISLRIKNKVYSYHYKFREAHFGRTNYPFFCKLNQGLAETLTVLQGFRETTKVSTKTSSTTDVADRVCLVKLGAGFCPLPLFSLV
jgi:hypothetical protein